MCFRIYRSHPCKFMDSTVDHVNPNELIHLALLLVSCNGYVSFGANEANVLSGASTMFRKPVDVMCVKSCDDAQNVQALSLFVIFSLRLLLSASPSTHYNENTGGRRLCPNAIHRSKCVQYCIDFPFTVVTLKHFEKKKEKKEGKSKLYDAGAPSKRRAAKHLHLFMISNMWSQI